MLRIDVFQFPWDEQYAPSVALVVEVDFEPLADRNADTTSAALHRRVCQDDRPGSAADRIVHLIRTRCPISNPLIHHSPDVTWTRLEAGAVVRHLTRLGEEDLAWRLREEIATCRVRDRSSR